MGKNIERPDLLRVWGEALLYYANKSTFFFSKKLETTYTTQDLLNA